MTAKWWLRVVFATAAVVGLAACALLSTRADLIGDACGLAVFASGFLLGRCFRRDG